MVISGHANVRTPRPISSMAANDTSIRPKSGQFERNKKRPPHIGMTVSDKDVRTKADIPTFAKQIIRRLTL